MSWSGNGGRFDEYSREIESVWIPGGQSIVLQKATCEIGSRCTKVSGMERVEDMAFCQLSQMNQDLREFISHEVSHFKEKACEAKESTRTHVRKISRVVWDAAWYVVFCDYYIFP